MTVVNRTDVLSNGPVEDMASDLVARITNSSSGFGGVEGDEQWAAEIRRLADLRNATILAHNYQLPAIQDVADHVGDSLALSRVAAEAPEDTRAHPASAGRMFAGRLDHTGRPAGVEGRTPRRGRRPLRQHHRRREGA